jgi:hypothetical protein
MAVLASSSIAALGNRIAETAEAQRRYIAAMEHIAFPLILGACLALAGIALLAVALF